MKYPVLAAVAVVLAACSQGAPEPEQPAPATDPATAPTPAASHANADLAGEWIGPEGLFVKVTPTEAGLYQLDIAGDLDAPPEGVRALGTDAPGGIAFERDGQNLLLRRSTGDETGLTALEGKTDCVMVQEGEGFCRRDAAH